MKKRYDLGDNRILFATDNPEELKELLDKGLSALPIYTEENQDLSWPHSDYAITDPDELEKSDLIRIYQRINSLPWHILDTDRLIIREMTIDDVDDFYKIYKDPSITRYMEDLFPDPLEEKAYVKGYIDNIYKFYGYGLWTLIHKESGKIIGRAGISRIPDYDYPELGFMIAVPYQRQGLCFEACTAILEYAKKELGLNVIQARVNIDNTASICLLNKLNFTINHTPNQGYLTALHTYA